MPHHHSIATTFLKDCDDKLVGLDPTDKQQVDWMLQVAQIHATLAVADQLRQISELIRAGRCQ